MKIVSYNIAKALLTMASPEEALRALAVMHNYAPEEYKVPRPQCQILFKINNCSILSSSKMLLAFAFPSVQPESSNKTPKYCTRHCARGFSHIKDELLSMGTS